MDAKSQLSLSEIKVGIFVLVILAILGLAIFTIGTQVGLLEETFFAKTYLNNVSGLKAGDIALLAGVEVGNVIDVRISEAGQLPSTQSNQQLLAEIADFNQQLDELQQQISENEQRLPVITAEYAQAREQYGETSHQARLLKREVDNLERLLEQQSGRLEDLEEDIRTARANLQNIEVVMEIKSQYRDWIKEDSDISLGNIGLLGDKYIEIALGRSPESAPTSEDQIDTWLGRKTEEMVVITGTTQPGFEELITGADDVLSNVGVLSDKLGDILTGLSEGEGTVGQFITDTSFYDNLNQTVIGAKQTVDETSTLIHDLRQGKGTVGRLIQDEEVYDKINQATSRLEQLLARIEQGDGTLGKLIEDPSIYEKSDRLVANIESITHRMDAGEGTLGKLSTDDQLYLNLRRSLDQFSAFIEDVEKGTGTLGRLAKDEQLYQNLNHVSSEVVKLIYDFRQNPKKFLTIKLELF
jgi:phospholipid/cholesterol/gamma-HCH transport system substrate-binding protein